MKTKYNNILEEAIQTSTNTNFLQNWQPYDKLKKQAERAILRHFISGRYDWQPTHEESSKRPFKPLTFAQIENTLGLAYTSTGDYAGLWVCNGGYLWADQTHYFNGFAINTDGEVIAIAQDYDENEIYIKFK